MTRKSIYVFSFLFAFQTIMSCIPCNCSDAMAYEIEYNGLVVKAYDTSGFQPKEVSGPVYRNAFGLTASVSREWNRIADTNSSFGFNQASACSCPDDEYIYADPIDRVEIHMTEANTEDTIDVSGRFSVYGYGGVLLSLEDFFAEREDWHDGFQFELVDYAAIPDLVNFTIDVYLESGTILSATTQEITFTN